MTNINPLHVSATSPRTSDGWIHWNKLHNITINLLCLVINPLLHYTTLHNTTLHYTMLQFLNHSCLLVHVDSFTVLRAWLIHSDYLSKRKLDVNK